MLSVDHIFMYIYAILNYKLGQAIQDTIMCAILFDFMSYASIRHSNEINKGTPLEEARQNMCTEVYAQASFDEILDVCQGMIAIINSI